MEKTKNKIGWFLYDKKAKRILLHRRDHNAKESKDIWDCFGGKIERNKETRYEAFLRELCEELGITVDKNKVQELIFDVDRVIYYAPFKMEDTSRIRLGEGAGFAWFPISSALELDITAEAKDILNKFIKTDIGRNF